MNQQLALVAALVAGITLDSQFATGLAQGSLTPPPGAPAPVMKSLDQVEPRIPVSAATTPGDAQATFVINVPGSYYLTGNLDGVSPRTIGIRIDAVNVTLDLNGFTLDAGGASSAVGIQSFAAGGPIRIRNGQVRFWALGGISLTNNADFVIEDVQVTRVSGRGISVDGNGRLQNVVVRGAAGFGIWASDRSKVQIIDSEVNEVARATAGIQANLGQISRTQVGVLTNNGSAWGILAGQGAIRDCTVRQMNVVGSSVKAFGLQALQIENCLVADLSCPSSSAFGVFGAQSVLQTFVTNVSGFIASGIEESVHVVGCTVARIRSQAGGAGINRSHHVANCTVTDFDSTGINLNAHGTAIRNKISKVGQFGIQTLFPNCVIAENHITDPDPSLSSIPAKGIRTGIETTGCLIEGNHIGGSFDNGIDAPSSGQLVIRNTVAITAAGSVPFSIHSTMPRINSSALQTNWNPRANISF